MKLFAYLTVGIILMATAANAADMAVTVYNSDVGVVSETRRLEFETGEGRVAFQDVPDRIDPASVRFEVVGTGGDVGILEQNYAYDLVSTQKIYARFIDENIELLDKEGKLISGTLLAVDNSGVTLRDKSGSIKVVRLDNVAEVNFPSLPEGLVTRPTLFWKYDSDFSGSLDCRVSYQTSGLNWEAEYVGILSDDEKGLDLSGWASITNNTSKTFADATLKLVAGDISRAQPPRRDMQELALRAPMAKAGAGFEEKEFFEYHLYTLPRNSTVASKEVKQISLFEPASTAVSKQFLYQPDQNAEQVKVTLNFVNSEKAGLGMPLPEGRVRMFKADDDGSLILLGEDYIDHTPRDEELDLTVGYAFDIAAEERLMDQRQVSKRVEERTYEVELRNRKEEDITVKVEKKLYGDWEIISAGMEWTKEDARTLVFEVPVPAGVTTTVSYTVRITR